MTRLSSSSSFRTNRFGNRSLRNPLSFPTCNNKMSSSCDTKLDSNNNKEGDYCNCSGSYPYRVYLAVGSNLGDRFEFIQQALMLLSSDSAENDRDCSCCCKKSVRVTSTSYLYETAPMYVTDQPAFLNGVIEIETTLPPIELLERIKNVERRCGRALMSDSNYQRNGPRPVDLDILLYYERKIRDNTSSSHNTDENLLYHPQQQQQQQQPNQFDENPLLFHSHNLTIPHPRIEERDFVLVPLMDLVKRSHFNTHHPVSNVRFQDSLSLLLRQHQKDLQQQFNNTTIAKSTAATVTTSTTPTPESSIQTPLSTSMFRSPKSVVRVLPLRRGRLLHFNRTIVMGILNVTPDSFSDGNSNAVTNVADAVERAIQMVNDGADIIDIGGESTRPGANEVPVDEEIRRVVPVIEGIRKVSDIPMSIDTRHSQVALASYNAGVDIVNDVSGGMFDPNMLPMVGTIMPNTPMILMHMRGTPETMQSLTHYDNVVFDVGTVLAAQSQLAEEKYGVYRWRQILDPGIGFAKDLDGNLQLLRNLSQLRDMCHSPPILIGTSRKGFIGKIASVTQPKERDPGTFASCVAAICLSHGSQGYVDTSGHNLHGNDDDYHIDPSACGTIVRVHNVRDCKQAMAIMDAILNVR